MYQVSKIRYQVGAVFLISVILFLFLSGRAEAQGSGPFVFLTWRADSYAPADFRGKVLPTAGTKITAAVSVLAQDSIVNLSQLTIYWYLNDELIASGTGLQQVKFSAAPIARTVMDLRVEIPAYPGEFLIKTVEIPVVQPEVVIEAPFPERNFSGNQITLVAKPYFFNSISGLIFDWKVNGSTAEGEKSSGVLQVSLEPNVTPGFEVKTELTAYNPENILEESAIKTLSLIFSP